MDIPRETLLWMEQEARRNGPHFLSPVWAGWSLKVLLALECHGVPTIDEMLRIHGQEGWQSHWLHEIRYRADSAWLTDDVLRADWDRHNQQGGPEFVQLILDLAGWFFDNRDSFTVPGDEDADASESDDSAADDAEPASERLEPAGV